MPPGISENMKNSPSYDSDSVIDIVFTLFSKKTGCILSMDVSVCSACVCVYWYDCVDFFLLLLLVVAVASYCAKYFVGNSLD